MTDYTPFAQVIAELAERMDADSGPGSTDEPRDAAESATEALGVDQS